MIVTFVSQCEKNALNKTRRILDTFANRIGSRTWQTVITNKGLQAVKKLLRKTASKNTAVACHWIRSRSRSELVWIVGNRAHFNRQGAVPVNTTKKTILNTQWENDWHYLPLIKALTALAALFHDWGKASAFFQAKLVEKKIIADPLRHEWISTLFLKAYVANETDQQWLARLTMGEMDEEWLKEKVSENSRSPLANLPNAASLLAWLIVTHHRLPENGKQHSGHPAPDFQPLFTVINQQWGYENRHDEAFFSENLAHCFNYEKGLPSYSSGWLKQAKKWAKRLQDCLPLLEQAMDEGSWRLVLHHARLALMLGDHHYSSCDKDLTWQSDLELYANTDRKTGDLKQKLDEHLVGVMRHALTIAHLLPAFEGSETQLPRAYDIAALKKKSQGRFRWQETAVTKITAWRNTLAKTQSSTRYSTQFGFFAVNMASTGKGKTFANAKIMRALSADQDSLRYLLALGLRTLTLQTGTEYRERIGLDDSEQAVVIGSSAVLELYQRHKEQQKQTEGALSNENVGSESLETLIDNDIDYETEIPDGMLSTLFPNNAQGEKNRQFLYAPVLTCTIDYLMAATETKRGGRYILPSLRLMSSDLVIDEIDDFEGQDLIAIGRLIHLAGMLGRKVMISSATIPPDLAEGYFNAYQAGWAVFAKSRDRPFHIGCAWIDEFSTQITESRHDNDTQRRAYFNTDHQHFITKRVRYLKKETVKRKAELVDCHAIITSNDNETTESREQQYYHLIKQAIMRQHRRHFTVDHSSKKHVSFGVVRVANIAPCLALTRYLAETEWAKTIEIKVMAYHSQQLLLMRSVQEAHLDAVLKRDKENDQAIFVNAIIRRHIDQCQSKQLIFILVATPVEEVGRDHDFDWAVIEPSSYRSLVQLAGRVLRHREATPKTANLAIMQYNLKALKQAPETDRPAYCRPGYETKKDFLSSHDVNELLEMKKLAKRVDAQPRIQRKETLHPTHSLVDLEHHCIQQLLTCYESQGPETLQGWLSGCWWMTALPQLFNPFRGNDQQQKVCLVPDEDGYVFKEKVFNRGRMETIESLYAIDMTELSAQQQQRLWLERDYEPLLEKIAEEKKLSMQQAALRYGELDLPTYGQDPMEIRFSYCHQLGIIKK